MRCICLSPPVGLLACLHIAPPLHTQTEAGAASQLFGLLINHRGSTASTNPSPPDLNRINPYRSRRRGSTVSNTPCQPSAAFALTPCQHAWPPASPVSLACCRCMSTQIEAGAASQLFGLLTRPAPSAPPPQALNPKTPYLPACLPVSLVHSHRLRQVLPLNCLGYSHAAVAAQPATHPLLDLQQQQRPAGAAAAQSCRQQHWDPQRQQQQQGPALSSRSRERGS
jgi:hypothetical protein